MSFKLLIAGSRTLPITVDRIYEDLHTLNLPTATAIISGMTTRGPDKTAVAFTTATGLQLLERPAKWKREDGTTNRGAGYKRNAEMAVEADGALIYWDGISKDTKHMIDCMEKKHKPVWLITIKDNCLETITNPKYPYNTVHDYKWMLMTTW